MNAQNQRMTQGQITRHMGMYSEPFMQDDNPYNLADEFVSKFSTIEDGLYLFTCYDNHIDEQIEVVSVMVSHSLLYFNGSDFSTLACHIKDQIDISLCI